MPFLEVAHIYLIIISYPYAPLFVGLVCKIAVNINAELLQVVVWGRYQFVGTWRIDQDVHRLRFQPQPPQVVLIDFPDNITQLRMAVVAERHTPLKLCIGNQSVGRSQPNDVICIAEHTEHPLSLGVYVVKMQGFICSM